jgi:hypothetical protein
MYIFKNVSRVWKMALLTVLFCPMLVSGQEPLERLVQDGYFQQTVDHVIDVQLEDERHELHGEITTLYVNNSPDTLDFLWIHLWPNAYESGESALAKQEFRNGNLFMFWAMQRDLGGIDSLAFQINGTAATWGFHPEHRDIARLELLEPLLPGNEVQYTTPFRVRIPSGRISRLGHIGESYQLTQWYPKPAVYDRDGWHEMPYLNQGEFYSEYGSFDVSITLPSNYVVGATGDLNPSQADNAAELTFMDSLVLQTERSLNEAFFESDSIAEKKDEFPLSSTRLKTLRFQQQNVHDFAWFADKRWMVLKGSVELPNSKRQVTTWAMFTPNQAEYWKESLEYIADGTYAYSKWNGDYPYNHVTAVDGTISAGGGMEYPNVTVIGRVGSDLSLETVIVHEVGHNWFYGILGSNERTHAWMDEGINSFNETRYFVEKYGEDLGLGGLKSEMTPLMQKLDLNRYSYQSQDQLAYLLSARMLGDQPMQCHSDDFTSINYGTIVYKKSAAAFEYLRQAIGTEVFDAGMQAYFEAWKFKHPSPQDLRNTLERAADTDLSWFFEDVIQTTGVTDYALTRLRRPNDATASQWQATVKNRGDVPGPFSLSGQVDDTTWVDLGWHAGVSSGQARTVTIPSSDEQGRPFKQIRLDASESMLEYERHNNSMRTRGLLRKVEPLSIRMLTRLDRSDRTQVNWLPAVGWNAHDAATLGVVLHNTVIPMRDFEWMLMPMWSTERNQPVGMARVAYHMNQWRLEGQLRHFGDAGLEGHHTREYTRSNLRLTGNFNRHPSRPLSSQLNLDWIDVRSAFRYDPDALDPGFAPESREFHQAMRLNYRVNQQKPRVKQVWQLRASAVGVAQSMMNSNWLGIYQTPGLFPEKDSASVTLEGLWERKQVVRENGNSWNFRLYAGVVLGAEGVYTLANMGVTGSRDPLKDHLFFNRSESSRFNHVAHEQGGLTHWWNDALNQNYRCMASVKVSRDLFAGLSAYGGVLLLNDDEIFSAGIEWDLNILKIQVPLYSINGLVDSSNQFTLKDWPVTLVFDLERLSPYRLIRNGNVGIGR